MTLNSTVFQEIMIRESNIVEVNHIISQLPYINYRLDKKQLGLFQEVREKSNLELLNLMNKECVFCAAVGERVVGFLAAHSNRRDSYPIAVVADKELPSDDQEEIFKKLYGYFETLKAGS